ncbi:GGDEF domain-containing protein [Campylobacter sp.]|uniref:GGDEF domain-containing protein n=1 Tax=Campylobacter sp. TaxID=205 RepID=UPI00270DB3F8|nr:GGDEF domain-containing protein [Campylobacter sp.]
MILFIASNLIFGLFLFLQGVNIAIFGVYFIIAAITAFFYFQGKSSRDVIVFWVHGAVVFHALFGVWILGWGYGAENLLIWAIGANYFMTTKRNFISSSLIALEAIFYIALYLYRDKIGLGVISPEYKDECYIFIFACIFLSFLKRTMSLESIHIQNFRNIQMQNDKVKEISEKDYLTGLKNRMGVEARIKELVKICNEQRETGDKRGLLVALGDIDGFKNINDVFGHSEGDKILKAIAGVLSENFRYDEDIVCRWGGEEFLITAFISSEDDAHKILNRILRKINMIKTPDDKGVGITFGAVLLGCEEGEDINVKNIIKAADDLLYEGKRDGKNRVKLKRWVV